MPVRTAHHDAKASGSTAALHPPQGVLQPKRIWEEGGSVIFCFQPLVSPVLCLTKNAFFSQTFFRQHASFNNRVEAAASRSSIMQCTVDVSRESGLQKPNLPVPLCAPPSTPPLRLLAISYFWCRGALVKKFSYHQLGPGEKGVPDYVHEQERHGGRGELPRKRRYR